jgi:hypothetical protein
MEEDLRSFGAGLMAYFVKAAFIDRSIAVGLDTRVEHLLVDDRGAVIGVRASRGDETFEVRARRGVLLATGGYDWNPALTRAYTHLDDFHSACPPIVTGDHLTMGAEIGAEVVFLPPVGLLIALGFSVPGETYEDAPMWRYTAFEPGAPHPAASSLGGRTQPALTREATKSTRCPPPIGQRRRKHHLR